MPLVCGRFFFSDSPKAIPIEKPKLKSSHPFFPQSCLSLGFALCHQKVVGSIPLADTLADTKDECLILGQGEYRGNQSVFLSHINVSLSLSPTLPL